MCEEHIQKALGACIVCWSSYEVLSAPSGRQGICLYNMNPDIILVVVQAGMNDVSGLEVIRELHKHPNHPPLWLMSGHMPDELYREALEAGAAKAVVSLDVLSELKKEGYLEST